MKALEVLQYDPHFYRAVGTFLDPGFTGIILLLTLIVIVYNGSCFKNGSCRAFSPVRHPRFVAGARREPLYASHPFCLSKLSIIIHYPLSILLYLALALTYSRASWLAFLVGMSVLAFYKKSWKIFLAAAGVLVLTWFLIPQPTGEGGKSTRTYTIQARFQNYQQAVKIFNEKPILGVGFNTLRYYQKNQPENQAGAGLDNSWLFVLATTGILGLASYLWLWFKALDKFKNPLIVSSFSALFIHAFFVNSLFYSWVMAWIWIILAMENR